MACSNLACIALGDLLPSKSVSISAAIEPSGGSCGAACGSGTEFSPCGAGGVEEDADCSDIVGEGGGVTVLEGDRGGGDGGVEIVAVK
eukprot:8173867-Karenia_brevis.AAC.1